MARRQTEHLRKLVDDLLEVNRALMDKLTLAKTPLALAETVGRCVDTLQAGGRTRRFAIHLDAAPALVDADPTRLVQIIDNILDNAVKYSPDGGRIDIGVRQADGWAELVVRDSGVGFAPELLPKVFTIFVQGAQSLQRAQGGLGIGLSLVRRLVEMHGGGVAIDSAGSGPAPASRSGCRCWPRRRRRRRPPAHRSHRRAVACCWSRTTRMRATCWRRCSKCCRAKC